MANSTKPSSLSAEPAQRLRFEVLEDRVVPVVELISGSDPDFIVPNGISQNPQVSDDGRYVVFQSAATNLVPGQIDSTGTQDLFFYDRVTKITQLVSHTTANNVTAGNCISDNAQISGDGKFVVFQSKATNLVSNNANGVFRDVFLWERDTGKLTLISDVFNSPGTTSNGFSQNPKISDDGDVIVFESSSTNLISGFVDNNSTSTDLYAYTRSTDTMILVSRANGSSVSGANSVVANAVLSDDGNVVAYESNASNLVMSFTDNNAAESDIFAFNLTATTTKLISGAGGSTTAGGNGGSFDADLSDNGQVVVFTSGSTDLVAGFVDNNGTGQDIFVNNAGNLALVNGVNGSATQGANGDAGPNARNSPVVSGDGKFVAFGTQATDQFTGFTFNLENNIFLRELATNTFKLVTRDAKMANVGGFGESSNVQISDDGSLVTFNSGASNLILNFQDNNGAGDTFLDVFLFDRDANEVSLLSSKLGSQTATSDGISNAPFISDDGSVVVFNNNGTNLVAGVTNPSKLFAVYGFAISPLAVSFDFGDAPNSYGVAQHKLVSARLGANRDEEAASFFSANADGDDTNGVDDEDGLVGQSKFVSGSTGTLTLNIQGVTGFHFINTWIDWDRSGTFEAGEQVVTDLKVSTNGNVTTPAFNIPGKLTAGNDYVARIRIADVANTPATSAADSGEVEDHLVSVESATPATEFDFGDAPNTYGVAQHKAVGVQLGSNRDAEAASFFSANADGDDTNGDDDEDGLVDQSKFVSGSTGTLTLDVQGVTGNHFVSVWIDWDHSGTFEAGERVLADSLVIGNGQFTTGPFNIPGKLTAGNDYVARIRVSDTSGLTATGSADSGEVEDHLVTVTDTTVTEFDFGDAPSSYGVAQHKALGAQLGNKRDTEAASLFSANADGDDNDGDDDEDGFVTQTTLTPGSDGKLTINVQGVTGDNFLNIWADWNRDGKFEVSEQIASDVTVSANGDVTIPAFNVPVGTKAGNDIVARIRLADAKGISFDGNANSGEVEDLLLTVTDAAVEFDFGDAADTYGIAQHKAVGVQLGNKRDAEASSFFSTAADGDDNNSLDDEDGLASQSNFVSGSTGTLTLDVQGVTGDHFVSVWVDWNRDGTFEASELVVDDLKVSANGKFTTPAFDIPAKLTAGNNYVARLRVADVEGLLATGSTNSGEVEDHLLVVEGDPTVQFDFGDAPDTYGSAQHKAVGVQLGSNRDAEAASFFSAKANGDDTNPVGSPNDEDGLVDQSKFVSGSTGTLTLDVQGVTGNHFVSVWIDWDRSGTFEAGEQVVDDLKVSANGNITTAAFNIPDKLATGNDYVARIRVADVEGLTATGSADSGEVEDHLVSVESATSATEFDFGDAPNTYGVAQHKAVGVQLGSKRDTEAASFFSTTANGDDTNPIGGPDDEDGLVGPSILTTGETGTLTLDVQGVTGNHFVSVWVDWNRDGKFEAGEQVIDDLKVSANGNITTPSFDVPTKLTPGNDYIARIRVADVEGLSFDGNADSGEVEDHLLTVSAPAGTAKLVYVSPTFTGAAGTVVDGDLTTAGQQDAKIGTDAFATIAEALAAVADMGTLLINDADYTENVTFDRMLELVYGTFSVDSFSSSKALDVTVLGTSGVATLNADGNLTIGADVTGDAGLKFGFGQNGNGATFALSGKLLAETGSKIEVAGGAGVDVFDLTATGNNVSIDLAAGQVAVGDLTYIVSAIEQFITNVPAQNLSVKFTENADVISIDDDGTADNQFSTITGANNLSIKFFHPTDKLQLDLTGGDDKLSVTGLDMKVIPAKVLILGGTGNDTLMGTPAADSILGGDGNDSVSGGAGNDTIDGAAGDDSLEGAAGDDSLIGGTGMDEFQFDLDSPLGFDILNDADASMLDFSNTNDPNNKILIDLNKLGDQQVNDNLKLSLTGGITVPMLMGTTGNDTIVGTDGADTIMGLAGDDIILAGDGNDIVDGGEGNDSIDGGAGNDNLTGGIGNDLIFGGAGLDNVLAGDGNDSVGGGAGNDTLNGGAGNDLIFGEVGDDDLIGGDGLDSIGGGAGADVIDGGLGNDSLFGEDGDDTINGAGGNDSIGGGAGNDSINGGDGDDFLFGESDNDTIIAGTGNDIIGGGIGNDSLLGEAGNDSIEAEDGDDTVFGNAGFDTVHGGSGSNRVGSGDVEEAVNYIFNL